MTATRSRRPPSQPRAVDIVGTATGRVHGPTVALRVVVISPARRGFSHDLLREVSARVHVEYELIDEAVGSIPDRVTV
jgi:hypothetical protein